MFFEALLLLGVMRAAILFVPFRKIAAMMGLVQGAQPVEHEVLSSSCTEGISWAIRAAAARTPWESACLVRALTGMAMLSRRRIKATLYLGVAKDESGAETMKAHAWLSCGDNILVGAAGYEEYAVISAYHW